MKIINVMASSLDGRIGIHDREGDRERSAVGLSDASDQQQLRQLIETADAIIVGATSIRSNEECLDHPGAGKTPPTWYIFAKDPIPENFAFWKQTHIPRVLLSPEPLGIVPGSQVENIVFGDADPALFLMDVIKRRQHSCCLLFGGGIVNGWFYKHGLIDELNLTLAPLAIGKTEAPFFIAPSLPKTVKFKLLTSHSHGSFVFLRYAVLAE